MHYLIDGYNLLHHVGRLLAGRNSNLHEARLDLLRLLQQRFAGGRDAATVVFDAQKASGPLRAAENYHGIEVRYTRFEEADDLIETEVRATSAPRQLTVVSNDRRIKEAARRKGCPTVECVQFWESLEQKATRPTAGAGSPSLGEGLPTPSRETPALSAEEVTRWQGIFGDLDRDPQYKDVLGPDDLKDL